MAATYVYVSNAADGDISSFTLGPDGAPLAGPRVKAADAVMPMAVSPDRRFLYVASRSQPFSLLTFGINAATGALSLLATSALADSFPYISLDRSGRFLLAASYGGNLVSVNAIDAEGRAADAPLQVLPVGRNAHSIRVDGSNRFAYVPCLGSDQVFQLRFDVRSGRLALNTAAAVQMPAMTGPRHFVSSHDSRFLHVLSEFLATVTTFAIDADSGLLRELGTVSGLAQDAGLRPGAARGTTAPGAAPRNTERDIWGADIHLTPDGRFLYISERTGSSIGAFSVDGASGTLAYLGSTPTERQPRGFAIDGKGRFMVVCGEKSDSIAVYAIDRASGKLALAGKAASGRGANWVEIVDFD